MIWNVRFIVACWVCVPALLYPLITHATGALKYVPGSAACSTTYQKIEVAKDKTVTLTCPAASTVTKPFSIRYDNGSAGCSAYTALQTNTADRTVTIGCATLGQLFQIEPPPSLTANTVASFKVSRKSSGVGIDTLTLTIPADQGYFPAANALSQTTAVHFGVDSPDTQTINAQITSSSGTVSVSVAGTSTNGTLASTPVSVSVASQCDNTPPRATRIVVVGQLESIDGVQTLYWGPQQTQAYKFWSMKRGEILAIQFSMNADYKPPNYWYRFSFRDGVPITNEPKNIAFSTCPGVFDRPPGTGTCSMEQDVGTRGISLLLPGFDQTKNPLVSGCQLSNDIATSKTYYLNIKTIDPDLSNDFYISVGK